MATPQDNEKESPKEKESSAKQDEEKPAPKEREGSPPQDSGRSTPPSETGSVKSENSLKSTESNKSDKINLKVFQPYCCEYAKSSRSTCRGCEKEIKRDELRLGRLIKNLKFDGHTPIWYHFDCFFEKFCPKSSGDFAHFTEMRYADQKRIQNKINNPPPRKFISSNYMVEYAISNRSYCLWCDRVIPINSVRLGRLDDVSDVPLLIGKPIPRWFHVDCFVHCRRNMGFGRSADYLTGFDELERKDQLMLLDKLPAIQLVEKTAKDPENPQSGPDSKTSLEEKTEAEEKLDQMLHKQSDILYTYIDHLKRMRSKILDQLLRANQYQTRHLGRYEKVKMAADGMAFGALEKCPKCDGQLLYHIAGFICLDKMCTYETDRPARKPFKIPEELKDLHPIFENYTYHPRTRLMPKIQHPVESFYPFEDFDPNAPERIRDRLLPQMVKKKVKRRHGVSNDSRDGTREGRRRSSSGGSRDVNRRRSRSRGRRGRRRSSSGRSRVSSRSPRKSRENIRREKGRSRSRESLRRKSDPSSRKSHVKSESSSGNSEGKRTSEHIGKSEMPDNSIKSETSSVNSEEKKED